MVGNGTREAEVVGSNPGNGRKNRTQKIARIHIRSKNHAMDAWVVTGAVAVSCSSTLPYVRAKF